VTQSHPMTFFLLNFDYLIMKNSILNNPIISKRYFFPKPNKFENPYFIECNNVKLACFYQNKHPEAKTVIFFHGNGETISDYLNFFDDIFDNAGFNLLLFEFRGYGMSSGEPTLTEILEDTEIAIKKLGLNEKNLVFYGRSVGSLYAIHAASIFPNANSLILESGIADISERIMMRLHSPAEINSTEIELQKEFEKHFNTKEKLNKFNGKSLVLHTINDHIINVSHGKQLFNYLKQPKKIHLFENGNHNTIFAVNQEKYFNLIFDFLK
jgi:alpha-beta hydrolase superfamily lysophospholipase